MSVMIDISSFVIGFVFGVLSILFIAHVFFDDTPPYY